MNHLFDSVLIGVLVLDITINLLRLRAGRKCEGCAASQRRIDLLWEHLRSAWAAPAAVNHGPLPAGCQMPQRFVHLDQGIGSNAPTGSAAAVPAQAHAGVAQ